MTTETTPTRTTPDQLSIPPDGGRTTITAMAERLPDRLAAGRARGRRDFTKFLVLTSFAFAVGQLWIVFENFARKRKGRPPVKRIARADAIPIGGSLVFEYPAAHDTACSSAPVPALRRLQPEMHASQLCRRPASRTKRFYCPCHNGAFDLESGIPTAGPPRRPLERILLEIRDGDLYAVGREVRS